ncbi:MAG: hypothetical protein ABI681_00175 [Gemmatimonadales bacterium]
MGVRVPHPPLQQIPPASTERRRKLSAIGAILTCPCHAVGLMFVTGGTALGTFLFRHIVVIAVVMGSLFLLSCWLLWQTRDSRRENPDCESCSVPEDSISP